MSEKKVIITLGCVIVFIAVYVLVLVMQNFGLRGDLGIRNGQLRQANKVIEFQRDSIQERDARIDVLKMSMAHKVIELRDSLKQKSNESAKWKQNYEKSKTTHIDRATPDAELDSMVTGLVTGH